MSQLGVFTVAKRAELDYAGYTILRGLVDSPNAAKSIHQAIEKPKDYLVLKVTKLHKHLL